MLNVSDETKAAFLSDNCHKTIKIIFPELNLTLTNDRIVRDSLSLSEALSTDSNFEFVGCISSSFKVKVYNVNEKLKGKKIDVYITGGDTEEIPLFRGIVDSAKIQADRAFKEIEAYDYLYKAGQKNVADWYNGLSYPITIGQIKHSLMQKMGLEYVSSTLVNDGITIPEKQFEKIKNLQALTVLKSICQINGCFGIQNRYGVFEFKYLVGAFELIFPNEEFLPGNDIYPSPGRSETHTIDYWYADYYKELEFEEFEVKPVEKVQIRDSEEDEGVTVGSGTNKYIIQANMFAYGLDDSIIKKMANNVHSQIKGITYHPATISNVGLPFLECGDIVTYDIKKHYGEQGNYNVDTFIILNRTLKGEQLLWDEYRSEGEEEQKEFITDIQNQLSAMRNESPDMDGYYTADEVDGILDDNYLTADDTNDLFDDKLDLLETPTGFTVVSCYTLPTNREPDTIYLIQAGVIVI